MVKESSKKSTKKKDKADKSLPNEVPGTEGKPSTDSPNKPKPPA